MEDPFDSVINAENSVYEAGFEAGLRHGKVEGRIDGFRTGHQKGLEFGDEMGFYLGFAEQMLDLSISESPESKLSRLLSALIGEVKRLECLNFGSSLYLDAVSKVRSRFKQVGSVLKLSECDVPRHSLSQLSF